MPERKAIVCFANSRKYQGRCLAGKELVGAQLGRWIRPVSERPRQELSRNERCYWHGGDPRLLDIVEMTLAGPPPPGHAYQTENLQIAPKPRPRKRGRWKWADLQPYLDTPALLWTNGSSSLHGMNDRVRLAEAARFTHSLLLIEPKDLRLEVGVEGVAFGQARPRLRAHFQYKMIEYRFSVTDPAIERGMLARGRGEYPIPGAYLCVSLGEPHTDNFCYKLVASVIGPEPF